MDAPCSSSFEAMNTTVAAGSNKSSGAGDGSRIKILKNHDHEHIQLIN